MEESFFFCATKVLGWQRTKRRKQARARERERERERIQRFPTDPENTCRKKTLLFILSSAWLSENNTKSRTLVYRQYARRLTFIFALAQKQLEAALMIYWEYRSCSHDLFSGTEQFSIAASSSSMPGPFHYRLQRQ